MAVGALNFGVDGDDSARYGRYFWRIGLADGREVGLHADRVEISGGVLMAWQETDYREGQKPARVPRTPLVTMALSAGQWVHFYAASVRDGTPVIVAHLPKPDQPAARPGTEDFLSLHRLPPPADAGK